MADQKFLINEEVIFFDKNTLRFRRALVIGAQLIIPLEGDRHIKYTLQVDVASSVSVHDEYVFKEAKDITEFLGQQIQRISNYEFCGNEKTGSMSFEIKDED